MVESLATALERVQSIQRQLQVLQQGRPGEFQALLAGATPGAAASLPTAYPPTSAPLTAALPAAASATTAAGYADAGESSSSWAAAVERPASLRVPVTGTTPAVPASGVLENGRLPDSALVSIGGGDRLQPEAASSFLGMRAAAAADGVVLKVNDSYRSLDEQQDMAARKGLYSQGGLAAEPGTSTHGLGRSVDLGLDGHARAWMAENAARFGFRNDVSREPWHWTFTPSGGS